VTFEARVPCAAAFELYGDNVEPAVVMRAARLFVHQTAEYVHAMDCHFSKTDLTNPGGYRDVFFFWRVTHFVCAGLITNDRAEANFFSAKIRGNFYCERKPYRPLVNINRIFRKFEFPVLPSRVTYSRCLYSATGDPYRRGYSVLAAGPIRIYMKPAGDADPYRSACGRPTRDRAAVYRAGDGLRTRSARKDDRRTNQ
jgi:hypothetical protein